jgi:MFS family permease
MTNVTSKTDNHPVKQVRLLAIVTAICLMGDSMLYIALPIFWEEVGLRSLWDVGLLLAINRLVRLPLSPFVGWLYTRMNIRFGLLLSITLATMTTLSYGLLTGFAWWIVMRSLWGVAWTFLRIGSYLMILELSDDTNRGNYYGMYTGIYRLGSLCGVLFGGICADLFGLRPVAIILGLLTLVSYPIVIFRTPNATPVQQSTNSEKTSFTGTMKFIRERKDLFYLIVTGLLVAMMCEGMFTSTLSFLIETHYASLVVFGIAVGASSAAGFLQAMRWAWGPWMSPWFGKQFDLSSNRRRVLWVSLIVVGMMFAVIPFPLPIYVWILVVIGIMMMSTLLATLMDALVTEQASTTSKVLVITMYTLALDIGSAIGPIIGFSMNVHIVYWICACILGLMALFWLNRQSVRL